MRSLRWHWALAVSFCSWLGFSGDTLAQTDKEVDRAGEASMQIERLMPAPGPGGFWQVDDGDVGPHLAPSVGLVSWESARPLVVSAGWNGTDYKVGDTLSKPISRRVGTDLLISVGLFDRVLVGTAVPLIVLQQGDRFQQLGFAHEDDNRSLEKSMLGDIRLYAKARFWGAPHGYGPAAAGALVVSLPTGDEENFAGEGGPVYEGRLIGSYRARLWAVAANAGVRIRSEDVQFLDPSMLVGNELVWGVAAEGRVPALPRFAVLAE
ncbi:MAG: hypothetical protein V2A73_10500, partial [Pseudomonadota bacterium]